MLFGALIDSTCRLWEHSATTSTSCTSTGSDAAAAGDAGDSSSGGGGRGSCLLFDTDALRWRVYGVVLGVQFLQLVFVVLLYRNVVRKPPPARHHNRRVISVPPAADDSPADRLTLGELAARTGDE